MSKNRGIELTERNPEHSNWYIERFRTMAANGDDLDGEARFIDAVAPRHSRILDAGCGPGRLGGYLARVGHDVVGVDIDPILIAAAETDHPGPTWRVADPRRTGPARRVIGLTSQVLEFNSARDWHSRNRRGLGSRLTAAGALSRSRSCPESCRRRRRVRGRVPNRRSPPRRAAGVGRARLTADDVRRLMGSAASVTHHRPSGCHAPAPTRGARRSP